MTIRKADTTDVGCLVDGHWGQYGVAKMIQIAADYGYADAWAQELAAQKLATMGPSTAEPLSDDDEEKLSDAADAAESWLNDYVAADDYCFGWHDGEFFYQSVDWFDEDAAL